jgi:hypothetical protein
MEVRAEAFGNRAEGGYGNLDDRRQVTLGSLTIGDRMRPVNLGRENADD